MSYCTDRRGRVVLEVGRNCKNSRPHYDKGLDIYLGNDQDRNKNVAIKDIELDFDMDSSTAEHLKKELAKSFSPEKQTALYDDFVRSVDQAEEPRRHVSDEEQLGQTRDQLIKNLCDLADKFEDWQIQRIIEVLGNLASQDMPTDPEFNAALHSMGKYMSKTTASRNEIRLGKKTRKRWSWQERNSQKECFKECQYPSEHKYDIIAHQLGCDKKRVRRYFKYCRDKKKK